MEPGDIWLIHAKMSPSAPRHIRARVTVCYVLKISPERYELAFETEELLARCVIHGLQPTIYEARKPNVQFSA